MGQGPSPGGEIESYHGVGKLSIRTYLVRDHFLFVALGGEREIPGF